MRLIQSLLTFRFVVKEVLNFAGGTIVSDNSEALIIHVQNEILTLTRASMSVLSFEIVDRHSP